MTALLFALGGPLQTVASVEQRFQLGDENPEQARLYLVLASMAALSLWAHWPSISARARQITVALLPATLLAAVAYLSGFWSVDPTVSREKGVTLGCCLVIGSWLGMRFSTVRLLQLTTIATSLAGVWSVLAERYLSYPIATSLNVGGWQGIFPHNNLLGAAFAGGIVTATVAAIHHTGEARRADTRLTPALAALGCGLSACGQAWLLARSRSAGAVFALAIGTCTAIGVGIAAEGSRKASARWVSYSGAARRGVAGVVAGAALIIALGPLALPASAINRAGDWQSRLSLWRAIGPLVRERLLAGWGFGAFWTHRSAEAAVVDRQFGTFTFHAHNGFIELALGLGIVGIVLFCAALAAMLVTQATALARTPPRRLVVTLWPVALVILLLVTALVESAPVTPPSLLFVLLPAFSVANPLRLPNASNRMRP